MTFGLQEQRRPPCFFLFSAFLGIPGLSSTRVIRCSLPIFSPIPCWGSFLLPLFPWRGSLYWPYFFIDMTPVTGMTGIGNLKSWCHVARTPTLCRSPSPYEHANTISTTQLLAENASRGASELRQATTSYDKAMTPPIPAYKTGLNQLRKTRATRTVRHRRKVL